mgnify:CR=1 FL=1
MLTRPAPMRSCRGPTHPITEFWSLPLSARPGTIVRNTRHGILVHHAPLSEYFALVSYLLFQSLTKFLLFCFVCGHEIQYAPTQICTQSRSQSHARAHTLRYYGVRFFRGIGECGVGVAPQVTFSSCYSTSVTRAYDFLAYEIDKMDISQNSWMTEGCGKLSVVDPVRKKRERRALRRQIGRAHV